ncbi:hypothetical protein [Streptomyces halstedii]|uniref:hypothetical protein n=1 Tax=Streptomyces halstedii TaxID=1944 RepID=UPI003649B136
MEPGTARRAPGGTVNKESSKARWPMLSIPCGVFHNRWFAASRTEVTRRVSVVTPEGCRCSRP